MQAAATQAMEIQRPAEGSGSNDRAGLEAGHAEGSGGDADEAGPEAAHDGDDAQPVAWKVASDVEEMKSWPCYGRGSAVATAGPDESGPDEVGDGMEARGGGAAGNGGC